MKFKTMMKTVMQQEEACESQQSLTQSGQISESLSLSGALTKEDDEMARSAVSTFMAKEEEIQKRKMEVQERVLAQIGRIEQENRRLAAIREELEAPADPRKKEVTLVQKKIDAANKELKTLGQTCQKKEREYKEALEAFNGRNKEKVDLVTKLMELANESEGLMMQKLEELSKNLETLASESEGLMMQKLEELSKNLETARKDGHSPSLSPVHQKNLLNICCCWSPKAID